MKTKQAILRTTLTFICGVIAGVILLKSSLGHDLEIQAKSFSSSIAQVDTTNPSSGFLRYKELVFEVEPGEDEVCFALEVVNPTNFPTRIVGFQSSCSCSSIDQRLPLLLPSKQSRFISGKLVTSNLKGVIVVNSEIYLESGLSDRTKFEIRVTPRFSPKP